MHTLLAPVNSADQTILNRARKVYAEDFGGNISDTAVRELTARQGIELATAVLYIHFEQKLLTAQNDLFLSAADHRPLMVAIAPGAFYREHPEVGADGRELMELSSHEKWDCVQIPSESLGTPTANAEIINRFLKHSLQSHRVILVSLSKGTADAAVAASLRPDLMSAIDGWVSVSGVNQGTMMADWLLDKWYLRPVLKFMLWRHGADVEAVSSLRYRPVSQPEDPITQWSPPKLHIAGFPLRRHLSCRRARLWYRRFRSHGPNDGVVMLEDLLRISGLVIPIWGADHYLRGDWNVARSLTRLIGMLNSHKDIQLDSSKTATASLAKKG